MTGPERPKAKMFLPATREEMVALGRAEPDVIPGCGINCKTGKEG